MIDENQSPAPWLSEKEKRKTIDESKRYHVNEEKLKMEKKKELVKQERKFQMDRLAHYYKEFVEPMGFKVSNDFIAKYPEIAFSGDEISDENYIKMVDKIIDDETNRLLPKLDIAM